MKRLLKFLLLPPYFFLLRQLRQWKIVTKPTINVCISTNRNYAAKTIPDLLKSLYEAGLTDDEIVVVEGGHEHDARLPGKQNYYLVSHNSFDLTALITLSSLKFETDYWFLLHDTCLAGKQFKQRIENIPHYLPEVIPIRNFPSMNIGAYHRNFLQRKKEVLATMINYENEGPGLKAAKAKAVDEEDILFKQPDVQKKIWVYNPWLLNKSEQYRISAEKAPVYYTNRIVEYFPQVDLYKFKANYETQHASVVEL